MSVKPSLEVGDTFGKLKVIRYISSREVYVECETCNVDVELYPQPFKISAGDLREGKRPCACNGRRFKNLLQLKILASRFLKDKGLSLKGVNEYKGSKTRVTYSCDAHGFENETAYNKIDQGSFKSCPHCVGVRAATGGDDRYTVIDTYRENDGKHYVKVSCNVCEIDKYSLHLGMDNLFHATKYSYEIGSVFCRCWLNKPKTEEQHLLDCKLSNPEYTPLRYENTEDRPMVTYFCKNHGLKTMRGSHFKAGHKCDECAANQKHYFYLNKIEDTDFYKYGISDNCDKRFEAFERVNKRIVKTLLLLKFYSSDDCKRFERRLKVVTKEVVSKLEFPDGYTEIIKDYDCLKIDNLLEEFKGKYEYQD